MNGCDAIRDRLQEYHDGELAGADGAQVRGHLAECAACALEVSSLERLDRLLRSVPPPGAPSEAEYLRALTMRIRSRRACWGLMVGRAAAASMLLAASVHMVWFRGTDVRTLVEEYVQAPEAIRREIERDVLSAGPSALQVLEEMMAGEAGRLQGAAAAILARHPRAEVRQRLLDRAPASDPGRPEWELSEIGAESSDVELMGWAVELARSPKTSAEAFSILRRLYRRGADPEIHVATVGRVRDLLASVRPAEQELGLRVVRELELRFLLPEVVDFLDVPALQERALEFLRATTGRDFGTDRAAWRAFFRAGA